MSKHEERRRRLARDRHRRRERAAMGRVVSRGECLLCGDSAVDFFIWTPPVELQRRLLAPSGQTWECGYALCEACSQLPQLPEKVNAACLAAWQGDTPGFSLN